MNTQQDIRDFVSSKTIAMAGVSRDPKSFSVTIRTELESKGYTILAVNPYATTIGGPRATLISRRCRRGWTACSWSLRARNLRRSSGMPRPAASAACGCSRERKARRRSPPAPSWASARSGASAS